MTEPRKPGRPRKEPAEPAESAPTPPGPIQLEIRAGRVGEQTKIVCAQRVHGYHIDQQSHMLTVTGHLREVAKHGENPVSGNPMDA